MLVYDTCSHGIARALSRFGVVLLVVAVTLAVGLGVGSAAATPDEPLKDYGSGDESEDDGDGPRSGDAMRTSSSGGGTWSTAGSGAQVSGAATSAARGAAGGSGGWTIDIGSDPHGEAYE